MSDAWPRSYEKLVGSVKKTRNSKYVSRENHREHIAVNKDKDCVYHIKIDGNVISRDRIDTKRIDYLLLNDTKKTAYLIELKGCHIKDAFVQMEISHKHLQPLLSGYDIKWRVVHRSRVTGLRTHEINKYLRDHPHLILGRTPMEESI